MKNSLIQIKEDNINLNDKIPIGLNVINFNYLVTT